MYVCTSAKGHHRLIRPYRFTGNSTSHLTSYYPHLPYLPNSSSLSSPSHPLFPLPFKLLLPFPTGVPLPLTAHPALTLLYALLLKLIASSPPPTFFPTGVSILGLDSKKFPGVSTGSVLIVGVLGCGGGESSVARGSNCVDGRGEEGR